MSLARGEATANRQATARVTAGTVGQHYLNTDIQWAINRHWFFQAGVYHLEALALPKTFGGLGGKYGLQFVF